jgi:hypothetical protein
MGYCMDGSYYREEPDVKIYQVQDQVTFSENINSLE